MADSSRRADILDAALAAFVADGYAATTIDRVAAHAGVAKQTVYNYFEDKEGLFLAALSQSIDRSLDELRAASEGIETSPDNPDEFLHELAHRIAATFSSAHSERVRTLVQTEAPRHPDAMEIWQEKSTSPVWSGLVGQLARLALTPTVQITDPVLAAGQFVALIVGSTWRMTNLGTYRQPTGQIDEEILDANVKLFLRAHQAPDKQ